MKKADVYVLYVQNGLHGKKLPEFDRGIRRKYDWGTRAPSDYAKLTAEALRRDCDE